MKKMYIVRMKDDPAKRRWKVREAKSLKAAVNAINMARASGSVGATDVITTDTHKAYEDWNREVQASVVQINSDGTERQPYTQAY